MTLKSSNDLSLVYINGNRVVFMKSSMSQHVLYAMEMTTNPFLY